MPDAGRNQFAPSFRVLTIMFQKHLFKLVIFTCFQISSTGHPAERLDIESIQGDSMQNRPPLEDEVYCHSTKQQKSSYNESAVDNPLTTLDEEQQVRIRAVVKLRQSRIAYVELEEKLEGELSQMRKTLNDKEKTMDELRRSLKEEHHAKIRAAEELGQARNAYVELEEKLEGELSQMRKTLNDKEKTMDELRRSLEEEHHAKIRAVEELGQARNAYVELEEKLEGELSQMRETLNDKEKTMDELLRSLEGEHHAKIIVDEELRQAKSHQEHLQSVVSDQRRHLEEELQQKATLEERVGSLELHIQEERRRHLSTETELQSALSRAEQALAQPRDWIIQREEIVFNEKSLGKGA